MVDKRSLLEKVIGVFKSDPSERPVEFDGTDAMKVVETGSGFIPGVGQALSPIVAAPRAAMENSRNMEWIQENFSVQSFETQAKLDPLFARELEAADQNIMQAVASSAAGAVGGAAGGWAGAQMGASAGAAVGSFVPGVGTAIGGTVGGGLGFIGGAIVGSGVASAPVDYIMTQPRTDAFAVIGGIQEDVKAGAGIDPRKVFVTLAASLPDYELPKDPETGKNYIEKRLDELSDGKIKSLQEALVKRPEIIDTLMADMNIDYKIKEYNEIVKVPDINDKSGQYFAKSATELFTEQLEAGVDPRILVLRQKRMQLVEKMNIDIIQESVGTPETGGEMALQEGLPLDKSAKKRSHNPALR